MNVCLGSLLAGMQFNDLVSSKAGLSLVEELQNSHFLAFKPVQNEKNPDFQQDKFIVADSRLRLGSW